MTLPEILTAVAILSILFALLIIPMMKAFGYIHTGNVRIGVQAACRSTFESLIRELSDAVYIYDNVDDPTLSSIIFVLPQGAGVNANQAGAPSSGNYPRVPVLLQPGPGVEYGTGVPVHVHYQIALTRPGVLDAAGEVTQAIPYWCGWEMENVDLRNAGLDAALADRKDNLYRLVRAEYYPSPVDPDTLAADNPAKAFMLASAIKEVADDPYGYDASQPDQFREPGWLIDDSLLPAGAKPAGTPVLCSSLASAKRRARLERHGLLVGLTPKVDVDAAWVTYTPPAQGSPAGTVGTWSVQPLVKFESLAVSNEALDPVPAQGQTYVSTYRADYGHWQWKARKSWSNPSITQPWARYFQTFDVQVRQRYTTSSGTVTRTYYTGLGRSDSASGIPSTAAKDDNGDGVLDPHYYVWRLTGSAPGAGVWPTTDVPTFDMTRYKAKIEAFRKSRDWANDNPYDTTLLPTLTGAATDPPYWPEMAYLLDVERGSVEFRVDAPVREPKDTVQPPGPLAPFQAPYGVSGDGDEYVPAPDGSKSDWVIKDVHRAAQSSAYGNGDGTSWIRIAPETMRVMVGTPIDPADLTKGYSWRSYTRTAERNLLSNGEFCFDPDSGLLSFDPNETVNWNANTKIRAWYQLQTNVQRASTASPLTSTDGTTVTASYFTKEVLRLTLGLRAYDPDTGKAQPFQLAATVRPRNLR